MVNSTWTKHHLEHLWWYGGTSGAISSLNSDTRRTLSLVYPPCNTKELLAMPLAIPHTTTTTPASGESSPVNPNRKRIILSIAQFRPEKDHMLQIRAMKSLVDMAQG